MKHLILAVLFLGLVSCKKEIDPDPVNEAKYDVTFKVTNFDVEVADYERQPEDVNHVDSYLTDICFLVYDEAGDLVFYQNHQKDYPGLENYFFDQTHLTLESGEYKLIAVGAQGDIYFVDSAKYSTAYLVPGLREVFYNEHPFTVVDHAVKDTIEIDRINSILEFQLTETPDWHYLDLFIEYSSVKAFPLDKNNEAMIGGYRMPHISGEFVQYETHSMIFRGYVVPDCSGNFDPDVWITAVGPRSNADFFQVDGLIVLPDKKVVVSGSVTGNTNFYSMYVTADSTYSDTTYVDLKLKL